MMTPLHRPAVAAVLLGIFGCGERTGDPKSTSPGATQCSTRCTITGDSASVVVTASGADITYQQGGKAVLVLSIPGGAVRQPTVLTIGKSTTGDDVTPGMVRGAVELGPDGLVFDHPARLTMFYDPAAVATTSPEDVTLYLLRGGRWTARPTIVDAEAHTATVALGGFSGQSATTARSAIMILRLGDSVAARISPDTRSTIGLQTPLTLVSHTPITSVKIIGGTLFSPGRAPVVTLDGMSATLAPVGSWTTGTVTFTVTSGARTSPPRTVAYTVDTSLPGQIAVSPGSGRVLQAHTPIQLTFSKSMVPASVTAHGSLVDGLQPSLQIGSRDGGPTDSTLTLAPPAGGWPDSRGAAVAVTVSATDTSGSPVRTPALPYIVDAIAPVGAAGLPGGTISATTPLSFVFSEPMDPTSLALHGNLARPAPGAVWNAGNTLLTLSPPTGGWAGIATRGPGGLTLDARDPAGNALVQPVALTYTVDPGATTAVIATTMIGPRTPVVLVFNRALDPSSITLSGTMAARAAAPEFSEDGTTMVVHPASQWDDTGGAATATLVVTGRDAEGAAIVPVMANYIVDGRLPISSASPASGATVGGHQAIVLTFNDTMDETSLRLGGSLAAQGAGISWTKTILFKDTLVLAAPAGGWASTLGGRAATLSVDASNIVGTPAPRFSASYTVDAIAPQVLGVTPASGQVISPTTAVTIVFNESMQTRSPQLSGTLASQVSPVTWSQTVLPNDTLVLRPRDAWTTPDPEVPATLTISAFQDVPGNVSPAALNLQYLIGARPVVQLTNLIHQGVLHSGFVIGTASDPAGVTAVQVALDGAAPAPATLAQPGAATSSWSFKLPTGSSTWRDGTLHTISVVSQGGTGTTSPVFVQIRKSANQDVNGDGYADVVAGAWAFSDLFDFAGRVYVFHSTGPSGIASQAAGSASTILSGGRNDDSFGWSVTLGDVNGDGYADAIAGATASSNAGRLVGRVYIFHSAGSSGVPTQGTASASTTLTGEATTGDNLPDFPSEFGIAVAAGDVNGDGYADVAVGSEALDDFQGRAYVFHSAGLTGVPSRLASAADTILTGEDAGDQFGEALAIGDVNGDHFADVVVGAWQYANGASKGDGRIYVFHSSGAAGVTSRAGGAANTILSSEARFDTLGTGVAVGDVNGDGFEDVAAGAGRRGRAYVFHSAGPTGLVTRTASSANAILTSTSSSGWFGQSVALGDVNGDGFADLAVGAHISGVTYVFDSRGPSGIASASTTAANTTLRGDEERILGFGVSVALTDTTGDGYMDVVAGAQFGAAYVLHSSGASGVASRTVAQADTTLTSEPSGGSFGSSVF